jgi:hypothetical protein
LQLTIPKIGTELRITKDWVFDLKASWPNYRASALTGIEESTFRSAPRIEIDLTPSDADPKAPRRVETHPAVFSAKVPKGSVLKIKKMNIKGGRMAEYNSFIFTIIRHPQFESLKNQTFEAALYDVNKINCVFNEATVSR